MAEIVTKELVKLPDIEIILEDAYPECRLERDPGGTEIEATLRVGRSAHVGLRIILSVHSVRFSHDSVRRLRELGVPDALLSGLESADESVDIPVSGLRSFLAQRLDKPRAKEFFKTYREPLVRACAVNSQILIVGWDPNGWGGAVTGGSALAEGDRNKLEDAVAKLLSAKIEHVSSKLLVHCFIATAAAGDPYHPDVVALRIIRDLHLRRTGAGRLFVRTYEKWSPVAAQAIRSSGLARRLSLLLIVRPCAKLARRVILHEELKRSRPAPRLPGNRQ